MTTTNITQLESYAQRVVREAQEKVARKTALLNLAIAVAPLLDPAAVVSVQHERPAILLPGDFVIIFEQDAYGRNDRITITGRYGPELHDFKPYNVSYPEITVGANRSAAQIARDILRRFLDTYKELLTKMRESKAKSDANIARKIGIAKQLGALAPGLFAIRLDYNKNHENPPQLSELGATREANFYGSVKVTSDDTISIDLINLSIAQAGRIMQVLGDPNA